MISYLFNYASALAVVVDAAITLALAVAALTPTDKDDGVVSRVQNVWRMLRGR